MGSFVWLPLILWATLAQTEIAPTEQSPFAAKILAISADGVEFEAENQRDQLPLDKLRRIKFADAPAGATDRSAEPLADNAPLSALLSDGSQLDYRRFNLSAATAEFELADGSHLSVPGKELLQVQFQTLTPAQWLQWQAIAQSRASADLLALIRSPEAIEKLEGVVLAVSPEQVSFDYGGQAIDAPLAKLAGIRFFSNSSTESASNKPGGQGKLTAITRDRSGNRWMCSAVSLSNSSLSDGSLSSGGPHVSLTLRCGASLQLPLEQLAEIDFSSGSTQFLAELSVLQRETTETARLSIPIAGANELFGAHPRDLRQPGNASLGPSLEFLGAGSISFRIPSHYTRLRGEVELSPPGSRFTPCIARVKLDKQVVWEQRLSETGRRWPVDVAVTADARLQLEVALEAETAIGDVVLWHDIRLVK